MLNLWRDQPSQFCPQLPLPSSRDKNFRWLSMAAKGKNPRQPWQLLGDPVQFHGSSGGKTTFRCCIDCSPRVGSLCIDAAWMCVSTGRIALRGKDISAVHVVRGIFRKGRFLLPRGKCAPRAAVGTMTSTRNKRPHPLLTTARCWHFVSLSVSILSLESVLFHPHEDDES